MHAGSTAVVVKSPKDWCDVCQLNTCIAGRCYKCGKDNGTHIPRRKSGPRLPKGFTRKDFEEGFTP